jgi:putative transposase
MPTPSFHRIDSEGQPYFVTTVTRERQPLFGDGRAANLFVETLYECRRRYGFQLLAFSVMPDHVHLLLLPQRRNTISDLMRFIKGAFARAYNVATKGSGPIWQPSFYERYVRDERALWDTISYIDSNPVTAGMCAEPQEYPYGSASGRYETDLMKFLGS